MELFIYRGEGKPLTRYTLVLTTTRVYGISVLSGPFSWSKLGLLFPLAVYHFWRLFSDSVFYYFTI